MNPHCLICLLGLLALAACGGGGSGSATVPAPQPPSGSVPTQLLTNAKSQSQLLTTFRAAYDSAMSGQGQVEDAGVAAAAPASDSNAGNFSVTYTAENSVDEYDAVKYDGEYLYIAPTRSMDCCVALDAGEIARADQAMSSNSASALRLSLIHI